MKVLVAGKGFIGEAVGRKLEENHDLKYLDRSGADYEQDITEGFSIEERFDVLIHTIGLAPGFSTAEEYREVHVNGTRNLVDAVKADKIVYISALKAGEIDHSFFRTKKEAEEIIEESGTDYTIIRPSTVYGQGNRLLEMMRKTAFTRVFPRIRSKTQPILLDDLVEIVERSLTDHAGEVLQAGGPEKMSIGEMARRIYQEEGCRCFLVPYPQFLLELKLIGLSFLPPPFQVENIQILRHENTTDENDAARIIDLSRID